jgi:hypothetical protein
MLEAAYPGDIHLRQVNAFQKPMLFSGTDLRQLSVAMLGPSQISIWYYKYMCRIRKAIPSASWWRWFW